MSNRYTDNELKDVFAKHPGRLHKKSGLTYVFNDRKRYTGLQCFGYSSQVKHNYFKISKNRRKLMSKYRLHEKRTGNKSFCQLLISKNMANTFKEGNKGGLRPTYVEAGYSGSKEFSEIPLRTLFQNAYGMIPHEWDFGRFSRNSVHEFIEKHKKKIIIAHYSENAMDFTECAMDFGGVEGLYIYVSLAAYDESVYTCAMLFKEKTQRVQEYIDHFYGMVLPEKKEVEKKKINIISQGSDGKLELISFKIKEPDIDFGINYNEDFSEIHELITKRLTEELSKGLVLLHGEPGTGKTTYIRYLINNIDKKIIYIPPSMVDVISQPSFIKFLLSHPNSILIVEDAENVLMKRGSQSSQAIANILNLSDGLLSDCANIQVVATFNTSLKNIDDALLRKGRLIARYEFKELSSDRIEKLCDKLGITTGAKKLSDIYGSDEISFETGKSKIGFVGIN